MSFITRSIFRWGLIGGLALGGITLLIGPERVAVGLSQIRHRAQSLVDNCVDNPEAIRRQLEQLAEEYPDRIAEIRGEIAEVEHQIAQFEEDIDLSNRVVALTTEDLTDLKTLVARAEAQTASKARQVVHLRFQGVRFDIEEAYNEGRRINTVRGSYQDRLAHDQVQLQFLNEQKAQLTEILGKLDSEYSTYQTQLWQLDREIDAIQRNERLIELTKQQQATLESYDRFGKVDNLHQIQAKLAEIKTIQEAQLQQLHKLGVGQDYEAQARYEMGTDDINEDPFDDTTIDLEDETENSDAETIANSIAWADPIVIE